MFDFNASLIDVAPVSPILLTVDLMKIKIRFLWMSFVLFLLSSLSRFSFVSVLFDFSASLNDVAPDSLTLLSVDLM